MFLEEEYDNSFKFEGQEEIRIIGPVAEPITLSETKLHLRIRVSDRDVQIRKMMVAARHQIEAITSISMMQQTWRQSYDNIGRVIDLLHRPLLSVVSMTTVPNWSSDDLVLVPEHLYYGSRTKNAVVCRSTWPQHRGFQSVEVNYVAGYRAMITTDADTADAIAQDIELCQAAVPADLKLTVMEYVALLYENPDGTGIESQFKASNEKYGAVPPMIMEKLMTGGYLDWRL